VYGKQNLNRRRPTLQDSVVIFMITFQNILESKTLLNDINIISSKLENTEVVKMMGKLFSCFHRLCFPYTFYTPLCLPFDRGKIQLTLKHCVSKLVVG
jgi:hypothetical protein